MIADELSVLSLVDHHCHPVAAGPVDDATFQRWCTESHAHPPAGVSSVGSQLAHAVRRWCPPALGLPALSPLPDYLEARRGLSTVDVNNRLLRRANLRRLLVDTGLVDTELVDIGLPGSGRPGSGLPSDAMLDVAGLAEAAGAPADEVVRLESLAERVVATTDAAGFPDAFTTALDHALTAHGSRPGAVAVKSIVAYRYGLDLPPQRPARADVVAAAGAWLRHGDGRVRLTDPVLLRFLLWSAVDAGRPIQLHTGFGDADAAVRSSDPALLQPFLAATESARTPIVLLHCYPYHRQAGLLAHLYPHVYLDLGLTIGYLGARSTAVLGEFLELAPFGKLLYSSDGYGLAELILVGAAQFRHAMAVTLAGFVTDGAMTAADAHRIAAAVGGDNASRLYDLPA